MNEKSEKKEKEQCVSLEFSLENSKYKALNHPNLTYKLSLEKLLKIWELFSLKPPKSDLNKKKNFWCVLFLRLRDPLYRERITTLTNLKPNTTIG